eukprot:2991469-Prymnesium_polylepis.1
MAIPTCTQTEQSRWWLAHRDLRLRNWSRRNQSCCRRSARGAHATPTADHTTAASRRRDLMPSAASCSRS